MGTLLRLGIFKLFPETLGMIGTLSVNAVGCFLLGFVTGWPKRIPSPWRTGLTTGFIGSFTTFSGFEADLAQTAPSVLSLLYAMISIGGGLYLSALGMEVGKRCNP